MKLIEQKVITSQYDFVRLGIIDWNRLNGTSPNIAQAMQDISSWFIDTTAYTIIEHDLSAAPKRDDFPEWHHIGNTHEGLARLFWNDFKYCYPEGELIFSDEPDFYGTMKDSALKVPEDRLFYETETMGHAHFWGDIGQVSASAFALTAIRKMQKGDLWISLLSKNRQVIIEALDDLNKNFYRQVTEPLLGPPSERKTSLIKHMLGQ